MRTLSMFSALDPHDLEVLGGIISYVEYSPGQTIFLEADPAESLFVISTGCVRLHKLMADGRRQITGFMFASDFLGLALHDTYATTSEAVTDVSVCRFMRPEFESLLEEFPQLEKKGQPACLRSFHSWRSASCNTQPTSYRQCRIRCCCSAVSRRRENFGTFLMVLAHCAAKKGNQHVELELPMTRHDVADYLGLTVGTVNRCFTRLQRQGVIELSDPQNVRLVDMDRLAELSGLDIPEPK